MDDDRFSVSTASENSVECTKMGSLCQKTREPIANQIYFILFSNTRVVEPGSKVTVVIGDFKGENLIVEYPETRFDLYFLRVRDAALLSTKAASLLLF